MYFKELYVLLGGAKTIMTNNEKVWMLENAFKFLFPFFSPFLFCIFISIVIRARTAENQKKKEKYNNKKGFYSFDGVYLTLMVYLLGA